MYKDQFVVLERVEFSSLTVGDYWNVTIAKVQQDANKNPTQIGPGFQFKLTDATEAARYIKGATVQMLIDVVPANGNAS